MKMEGEMGFRCPFEVQGERENTIRDFALGSRRTERLATAEDAFRQFYTDPKILALRFNIPELNGAVTFEDLEKSILPFRTDIIAAEISCRLFPHLPYQTAPAAPEDGGEESEIKKFFARKLSEMVAESIGSIPRDSRDIGDWYYARVRNVKRDEELPLEMNSTGAVKARLAKLNLNGLIFLEDRQETEDGRKIGDPTKNRNNFYVIQSPLYPEKTGRYRKNVAVVVNREADLMALSANTSEAIRRKSNIVLKSLGIKIGNVDTDQQTAGLWIPTYAE